ncbi:MAG: SGNH/GDSL hydrolase family protein [Bacteroidales bacterium]
MVEHKQQTLLFLGASITQGMISSSYVRLLKSRLGKRDYRFINQGIAGYESYNVLQKLDKAVGAHPDFVVLLVGTNDVLSSLDPKLAELTRKLKKIPHEPSLARYTENITQIVRRLKQETPAKIALASLPLVGERLDSLENRTIAEYNAGLRRIAESEQVTYLAVHEKQVEFLRAALKGPGKEYINRPGMIYASLYRRYLFFMSYEAMSKRNGYLLLTDGIHLNSRGAGFIADEIETFLHANQNS